MKAIELRIWDYIDGLSSVEERITIEQLIKTDLEFKTKYEELFALNLDFDLLEIDAPSMVFTNKVMNQIKLQTKPLSAEAKTDKKIIYSISSLFGFMMAACIILVINQIDWTAGTSTNQHLMLNPLQAFNSFKVADGFKNNFFYGFLMFDMIVGLMLLDKMMRKKTESY